MPIPDLLDLAARRTSRSGMPPLASAEQSLARISADIAPQALRSANYSA